MTGERTQTALARIDAAVARVNAAGQRVGNRTGDLARKHDHLRSAVAQTLHDLDLLIAEQEGASPGESGA
jgi:hypothetical protein